MKKITITTLAVVLSLSIMTTGSHAGNFQQDRTVAFSTRSAAFGAGHIQNNRYQHQRWNQGSSSQVYGNYNTNPYRKNNRAEWNHQHRRSARFYSKPYRTNGNLAVYNKYQHLRPNQRPLRQVNRRHITNRLRNGHWQVKKVWVPPKRHRVWKPGYSNTVGHWVPGKWIITKIDRGYFTEKRAWTPH